MFKVIIGLFSLICLTSATLSVPYFGQHDTRWGSQALGQGPQTISEEGCFLTVLTTMVNYEGIKINGALPTPSTMNSWFKSHSDFRGDILFYDAVEALGFTFEGIVTSTSEIKNAMNEGKFAMLHVLNGRHWVFATGFVSGGYSVMDPGSANVKSYTYGGVVGSAIYSFPTSKARKLYAKNVDIHHEVPETTVTHSEDVADSSAAHEAHAPSKHFRAHDKQPAN